MTREEQLAFCRICKNEVKDLNRGIICGITGTYADFEDSCAFFKEDLEKKEIVESTVVEKQNNSTVAPLGKRFANYLLVTLFFYIIMIFIGFFIGFFLVLDPEAIDSVINENMILRYLIGFILTAIYYVTFEALTGRTPGKYITKTRVVNMEGEKPDFPTILIRTLCRFIPFDSLSFLFTESTGWHDRFSGTRVVNN